MKIIHQGTFLNFDKKKTKTLCAVNNYNNNNYEWEEETSPEGDKMLTSWCYTGGSSIIVV